MKKKTVMFTIMPSEPVHSLWKNFIRTAPEGFRYVNTQNQPIQFTKPKRTVRSRFMRKLYDYKRKIPLVHYLQSTYSQKKYSRMMDAHAPDLIYCINGRVYYGNRPWVVDLETPSVFFGFNYTTMKKYKERIKKVLMKENCRALLPYSRAGKKGLTGFFGNDIAKKIAISGNVVNLPANASKIKHDEFTLLFTGSSNIADNFYARGGKEAVHAFLALAKGHRDVKLIMRCKIPEREKKLLKGKNVEIHEGVLDKEAFEGLFRRSDVYLFPAYIGYGLTILEAMSWGLPIVTADIMENGEHITNGVNGFKVRPPTIDYWLPMMPSYYFTGKLDRPLDKRFVSRIVEKLEYLYNNPGKRAGMGRANREKIKQRHSIAVKNKMLASVYRRALHLS